MRSSFLLCFCLFLTCVAHAQTPIQGIINTATPVSAVNCNLVTVASGAGITPGSSVMIMQMKGADVDQTNTATSGNILALNNAGNYELALVQSVNGNDVVLQNALMHSYDAAGIVQMITVPVYTDANITGPLLAQPWNGTSGGVIALICTGTLTMNADIDASGAGFKGGGILAGNFNCSNQNYILSSAAAGYKGESIAKIIAGSESGRGKWANGGGGGNPGNSGGGGGSLGGNGGSGGFVYSGCGTSTIQGVGGQMLTYDPAKAYFGGGGGGGYADNLSAVTPGTHGGGFIFVRAATLIANGFAIKSNGLDQTLVANDESAGGGGAGGSVFLDVQTFTGNLDVSVNGGKGGNTHNNIFSFDCHGPGGGGAGGFIALSQAATPPNVNTNVTGGLPGLVTHPNSSCYNTSFGATAGGAGSVHFNFNIPQSNLPLPELSLGNDTTVCPDGSFILAAPPGFTSYLWHDGSTDQSIPVLSGGAYSVTVTSGAGCAAADTMIISVPDLLANAFLSDTVVCDYDVLIWSAPPDAVLYQWNDGSTNASITINTPGTYSVTVFDANGCSVSDSGSVVHNTAPTVDLGEDVFACSGGSVDLIAPSGFAAYAWSNGNASSAFTTDVQGTYSVTVTDQNGCTATDDLFFANTPVYFSPIADRVICPPQSIEVTGPDSFYLYQWSHAAYGKTTTIDDAGTYALTVTDINGCTAADTFFVAAYCPPSLFFPNAFSPNGDGINDRFSCICYHVTAYELKIYNRWGQLLFTSNDPDHGWNGMYKNQRAPVGTYVYAVAYTFDDGITQTSGVQSGNFILLR